MSAFGISNPLQNPTLELRSQNGALLRSNDDWTDDPTQATEITAAGLAPSDPKESAIAATLPPGAYTAILAGLNDGEGVGTVEVYDRGPSVSIEITNQRQLHPFWVELFLFARPDGCLAEMAFGSALPTPVGPTKSSSFLPRHSIRESACPDSEVMDLSRSISKVKSL